MKVQFKKLCEEARAPKKATAGSAGYDLYSVEDVDMSEYYLDDRAHLLRTGVAVRIPEGHVGLLFARSSLHRKHLVLANSVGVIDSDYRGEIKVALKCTDNMDTNQFITKGERVAQLLIAPCKDVEFEEVDNLDITLRGTGGFGHSGS